MKKENNSGITLIALIITIIIMLILVGVTVNVVISGGLIEKAKLASEKHEEERIRENAQIILADYVAQGKKLTNSQINRFVNLYTSAYKFTKNEQYAQDLANSSILGVEPEHNALFCDGIMAGTIRNNDNQIRKVALVNLYEDGSYYEEKLNNGESINELYLIDEKYNWYKAQNDENGDSKIINNEEWIIENDLTEDEMNSLIPNYTIPENFECEFIGPYFDEDVAAVAITNYTDKNYFDTNDVLDIGEYFTENCKARVISINSFILNGNNTSRSTVIIPESVLAITSYAFTDTKNLSIGLSKPIYDYGCFKDVGLLILDNFETILKGSGEAKINGIIIGERINTIKDSFNMYEKNPNIFLFYILNHDVAIEENAFKGYNNIGIIFESSNKKYQEGEYDSLFGATNVTIIYME